MSETVTQDPPVTESAEAPKAVPVTTDAFTNCTSRCTRRAWNLFLAYRDNIEEFKTKEIRGKLTFATPGAATTAKETLTTDGGVKYITQTDNVLEFTATLAAVQLVLKHPDTQQFDALGIE